MSSADSAIASTCLSLAACEITKNSADAAGICRMSNIRIPLAFFSYIPWATAKANDKLSSNLYADFLPLFLTLAAAAFVGATLTLVFFSEATFFAGVAFLAAGFLAEAFFAIFFGAATFLTLAVDVFEFFAIFGLSIFLRTYKIELNPTQIIRYSFESLESTNSEAQKYFKEIPLNHIGIIRSAWQSKGKGQQGSHWESEAYQNLLISFVFPFHKLSVDKQAILSYSISLALLDCIKSFTSVPVYIKWPNDIFVEKRKISGILIENQIQGSQISRSIIGIGMNVNQEKFNTAQAISFKNLGLNMDLDDIENQLCHCLQNRLSRLFIESENVILSEYNANLYLIHQKAIFEDQEGKFNAQVMGATQLGQLLLKDEKGNNRLFSHKEVSFIE